MNWSDALFPLLPTLVDFCQPKPPGSHLDVELGADGVDDGAEVVLDRDWRVGKSRCHAWDLPRVVRDLHVFSGRQTDRLTD
jgi:hypothetical protein